MRRKKYFPYIFWGFPYCGMRILCKSLVYPHQTRCTSHFYSGAIWWIFLLIKYVMQGNDKDAKLMWLNHVNLV